MMAKKIDLGLDLKFGSIATGKVYFRRILEGTPIGQRVTDTQFKSLRTLYEAYCAKASWPLPSSPKSFFPKLEQQKGYTTKCFGVEFEDGKSDRFSYIKALSAVAIDNRRNAKSQKGRLFRSKQGPAPAAL